MFALINKERRLVLSPEAQIFSMPSDLKTLHSSLLFADKQSAERAAVQILSLKFKAVEVK